MRRDQLEHAIRAACEVSKDKEFVRLLLVEKMIDANILRERINALDVKEQLRERLIYWVEITAEELEEPE